MMITLCRVDRLETNFIYQKSVNTLELIMHALYVKLSFAESVVPLPQWFRYGYNF